MNEYLIPASAIAVELLRGWMTQNPGATPGRDVLASVYEEALLAVMDGAKRATAEVAMSKRSQP